FPGPRDVQVLTSARTRHVDQSSLPGPCDLTFRLLKLPSAPWRELTLRDTHNRDSTVFETFSTVHRHYPDDLTESVLVRPCTYFSRGHSSGGQGIRQISNPSVRPRYDGHLRPSHPVPTPGLELVDQRRMLLPRAVETAGLRDRASERRTCPRQR